MELVNILKPGKYFLIAILCFALAIILPLAFPRFTLEDQKELEINEISYSNVTDCYSKEFRIEKGYLCSIEISNYYENVTVYAKFMTKEVYDDEVEANTDPTTITGIYYRYALYDYPDNPTPGYDNDRSVTEGQSYQLNFMGNGNSGDIWSLPGDYVFIVYGENSWSETGIGEIVKFDLKIQVDGLGDLLNSTLMLIGTIVLLAACAITVIYLIVKKKR